MRRAGPRRTIDCPKAQKAHQPGHTVPPDPHALAAHDDEPSAGRLREGYFRNSASIRRIKRQRLGALALRLRSTATTARSTAGGIAGSASATDARTPPSHGAPTGSATGPARQKIPLHDQLPDLCVKIADLALVIPRAPLAAVRENLRRSPGASRRRPGSDEPGDARQSPEASDRPVAPQARSSPSAPPKTCVACSSAFLRQTTEYTLARPIHGLSGI